MNLRLKELRKKKGLTLEELAKEIGVTKATISRWESGERGLKISQLQKLADYFNVSVGYLLGNTDMPRDIVKNYNYKQEINSFIKDLEESNYKNLDMINKGIFLECVQAISLLDIDERKSINDFLWSLLEKINSKSN